MTKTKLTKAERSAIARAAQQKRREREKQDWGTAKISQTKHEDKPLSKATSFDPETFEEKSGLVTTVEPKLSNSETAFPYVSAPPAPDPAVVEATKQQAVTETETKPKRVKKKPMPKAFGAAASFAEKRLTEAIRERAEAMNKLAVLEAEIPSLVQIINALGGNASPMSPGALAGSSYRMPEMPAYISQTAPQTLRTPSLPAVPHAQGGAVSFEAAPEREDQFLPADNPGESWR